jgi:hypothetical protein
VNGRVTADHPGSVAICGSRLASSLSVTNASGPVLVGDGGDDGAPACAGNTIGGFVTLSGNRANVELGGSSVGGALTLTNNLGTGSGVENNPEVEGNTLNGGAACSGNSSVSNDSRPNKVTGARTGQCATI